MTASRKLEWDQTHVGPFHQLWYRVADLGPGYSHLRLDCFLLSVWISVPSEWADISTASLAWANKKWRKFIRRVNENMPEILTYSKFPAMTVSLFALCCNGKNYDQNQVEEERVYLSYNHTPSLRETGIRNSRQEPRGRNWSRACGGVVLASLLSMAPLPYFLIYRRTTCPAVAPVGWVLQHNSLINNDWKKKLEKKCLSSLTIRKIYSSKNGIDQQNSWQQMWGRESIQSLSVRLQPASVTLEIGVEGSQKAKNKSTTCRGYLDVFYRSCSDMVTAVLFTSAGKSEQLECPTSNTIDEWIVKIWYIYTIEYYAATKKKEIMSFC